MTPCCFVVRVSVQSCVGVVKKYDEKTPPSIFHIVISYRTISGVKLSDYLSRNSADTTMISALLFTYIQKELTRPEENKLFIIDIDYSLLNQYAIVVQDVHKEFENNYKSGK